VLEDQKAVAVTFLLALPSLKRSGFVQQNEATQFFDVGWR